jgi:hypothetical protein
MSIPYANPTQDKVDRQQAAISKGFGRNKQISEGKQRLHNIW